MVWKTNRVLTKSNKVDKVWADIDFDIPNKRAKIAKFLHGSTEKITNLTRSVDIAAIKTDGRVWVIAVNLDYTIDIVPFDQQKPEYLAHLAFIDPNSETINLLQFTEE